MRAAPALLALLALTGCTQRAFPEGFLFGAAIAGFQVDPGCPTLPASQCVDTNSDWYQWVTSGSELRDLEDLVTFEPLGNGPGYWELYADDIARARDEGKMNALRVSIEWSRVFPSPTDGLEGEALAAAADPAALAGYHAQLAAMKAKGLTPLVTLHHYTLPLWIHDGVACHKDLSTCTARGWLDRERTVREIAKYAGFVAKEFGAEVDLWATENEPFAVVLPGYLFPSKDRVNPPGLTARFAEAKEVMAALVEAHARMYDAVKANDPVAQVGLVYAMTPTRPANPDSRVDTRGADNVFYLYNTVFLDGVAKGLFDGDLDGTPDTAEPRADLAGRMDWLGINYYTRITVKGMGSAAFPTFSALTTFDPTALVLWEDYPKGLYDIQLHLQSRYGLPTYVTETGTDVTEDPERLASWVVRHAEWTRRAIRDGADVRGFFVWSLMDNYEWNHGTAMRFGLWAVADDAAKTRTARSAVATWADIIERGEVSQALLEKYPPE